MRIDDPKGNQVRKLQRGQKQLASQSPLGYSSVTGGATVFIGDHSFRLEGSGDVDGILNIIGQLIVAGILNVSGPWNLSGTGGITGAVSITGTLGLTGDLNITAAGKILVSGGSNDVTLGVVSGTPGLFFQSGARITNVASGVVIRAASATAQIVIAGILTTVTGNHHVTGNTTVGGTKLFRIKHPSRDGWVLQHASTESPVSGTEYWGEVQLDENGEADVALPEYFDALNRPENRSVLLTPVGRPFAVGADPIADGVFRVYGDPNRKVSWLVKAQRFDGDFDVEAEDELSP